MSAEPGKKGKVLFVNPPLLLEYGQIDYPYYAGLGVVSNAAAARAAGYTVAVADAQALGCSEMSSAGDGVRVGCATEELLAATGGGRYETIVVGLPPFMLPNVRTRHCADFFYRMARGFPGARIIAADCCFSGMHYIEYDPGEFLDNYPEAHEVVKYESERELPRILGEQPSERKAHICDSGALDPDTIPPPAWDLISLIEYFRFQRNAFTSYGINPAGGPKLRTLPLSTSRGCPYNCSFCTSNPGQKKRTFRPHSLEYLANVFETYVNEYWVQRVAILDGIPNYDRDRFTDMLDIAVEVGLVCDFPNGLRADRLTRAHLELLKRVSGQVKVSAESGDPSMLETIGKAQSLDAIEEVAAHCRELDMPLSIHYIAGPPGETVASLNRTLGHAMLMREKYGASPIIQNCVPIPGSRIHDLCRREGLFHDFDPRRIYSYFDRGFAIKPASGNPEVFSEMKRLFRKRLGDSVTNKVIINLTYECSNNCVFCAVGDRPRQHGDFGEHAGVLKKYRERGITQVDFDGGEPTLYPRFLRTVRLASKLGYEAINVTTNGRRLADRSYVSRFLLSGLTSVLVSLHGHTEKLHEKHTRAAGSFDETVAGIKHVVELKPERVEFSVNTTVTAGNAPHLRDFFEFAGGLGVEGVNVQFLTPFGTARGMKEYELEKLAEHFAEAYGDWKDRLAITPVNLVPCILEKVSPDFAPETGKYSRDMVFVDTPAMNLGHYLDGSRVKDGRCTECRYGIACGGWYAFGGSVHPAAPGE